VRTYRNLFKNIISYSNLLNAYIKTIKGKSNNYNALKYNLKAYENLYCLKNSLKNQTYNPGDYKQFYVYDPKLRLVSAPTFEDRIVHNAVCNYIEPIFDKFFIYDSYACRKGKGIHVATKRLKYILNKPDTNWALKCDILKYFASVDKDILLGLLEHKIADKQLIYLLQKIIYSYNPGIPIGNITSQLFANIYLNQLDQYVKHCLKVKYYLRYMDDFLIIVDTKEQAYKILQDIKEYLENNLKLKLHPKKVRIFKTTTGVDFVGYVVFKTHVRIRSKNVRKFKQKLRKITKYCHKHGVIKNSFKSGIYSWIGYAKHANTFSLRTRLFSSSKHQEFYPTPHTFLHKNPSVNAKGTLGCMKPAVKNITPLDQYQRYPKCKNVQLCLFDSLHE